MEAKLFQRNRNRNTISNVITSLAKMSKIDSLPSESIPRDKREISDQSITDLRSIDYGEEEIQSYRYIRAP